MKPQDILSTDLEEIVSEIVAARKEMDESAEVTVADFAYRVMDILRKHEVTG